MRSVQNQSEALPLTPIDPTTLSAPGPDDRDLATASERAVELLRAEEVKQKLKAAAENGGKSGGAEAGRPGRTDGGDGKHYEIPEKKKMTFGEVMQLASKRAFRGGAAGFIAGVVQVRAFPCRPARVSRRREKRPQSRFR